MDNPEKEQVEVILAANGLGASKLGLRFDRVVVTVLRRLRTFTDAVAPIDATVLVAITAPIRLPARTVEDLRRAIEGLLSSRFHGGDQTATVHGNDVRLRLVTGALAAAPRLIGFVHNRGVHPETLLDLAESWLLTSDADGAAE